MRVVYLGTPDFSVLPLKYLIEKCASFVEIVGVVTNPDRPVGRKQILTACPVKKTAMEYGLNVFSYDKIRIEGVQDLLKLQPDLMITCAFGQILSQEILSIAKYGVINIHASLLPQYRGASPIHYAIKNGDTETGITIMKTDIGIDTGDIMFQEKLSIKPDETCGELFERLSLLGAEAIVKAVNLIKDGKEKYTPQENIDGLILTKQVRKEDALIDFSKSAKSVVNLVRAYNPSPVAFTFLNDQPLKIYSAKESNGVGEPGTVINVDGCLEIACGTGSVKILQLQKAGGKPLAIKDFLLGNKLEIGSRLGK